MTEYGYRNGWPGVPGVRVPLSDCGCGPVPFPSFPCGPNGCPILLDTACVIYHKNGNQPTGLINLNLANGSTAELIFNTIDNQLGFINVVNWNIPVLRGIYGTVNNLIQFGQDVDTQLGLINTAITALQTGAGSPLSTTPTPSITFVLSGTLNHNIAANVNISAVPENLLSINSDGLYSAPQTLSINYTAKTLSITNGNTVNLASLICGVSGFLGDVSSDPSPVIDGQYWYNTTSGQLKMQLNGATRIITIT
jgi:hypothetical protein